MSIVSDKYFQALAVAGVVWYVSKTYRPSVLFDDTGRPRIHWLSPEVLAAIAGLGYLTWKEQARGMSYEAKEAAEMAAAIVPHHKNMTLAINPAANF